MSDESSETLLADPELEMRLIGAGLVDPTAAARLGLSAEDFASGTAARAWSMILGSAETGSPLSIALVLEQDRNFGKWLSAVAEWPSATSDLEEHAKIIRDLATRRDLKAAAEELSEASSDPELNPEEIISAAVRSISKRLRGGGLMEKRSVAERVALSAAKSAACSSTGIATLDDVLAGGLFAGKLYGIAARKKVGKSALLGSISHNMNSRGTKHLFITQEISAEEIEQRNIAREAGINSIRFLKGANAELSARAAEYAVSIRNDTFYEHCPGETLDGLKRIVSRAIVNHQICGVILDYWQLVAGKQRNETEEYHLRNVAQWLADLCRKENIWGLVAAQVNQDGNTRGGEGLKLACDVYLTLHREKQSDRAWMSMDESRYVLYVDVGSEETPALIFDKNGPHFRDVDETLSAQEEKWWNQ